MSTKRQNKSTPLKLLMQEITNGLHLIIKGSDVDIINGLANAYQAEPKFIDLIKKSLTVFEHYNDSKKYNTEASPEPFKMLIESDKGEINFSIKGKGIDLCFALIHIFSDNKDIFYDVQAAVEIFKEVKQNPEKFKQ